VVRITDKISAAGKAIQIPKSPRPRTRGSMRTKGINNRTCLSKDNINEGIAFPRD